MNTPEPGFYYHYKHDEKGSINNYAYEVLNVAHHTEVDDLDEGAMVIYQPIYESSVYKAGKHWDARPLAMFVENVVKDGKEIPRFTKIADPKIISELEKIKKEMYAKLD
ncbi:MAG TPA: DUF1653 domain-containing protein [Candidatus Paceibacterota bacterium]